MQQYLPFTVLKQKEKESPEGPSLVATVLTVYGIETCEVHNGLETLVSQLQQHLPFTVLNPSWVALSYPDITKVATALTVYGIETLMEKFQDLVHHSLQQLLPFTVCAEGCGISNLKIT